MESCSLLSIKGYGNGKDKEQISGLVHELLLLKLEKIK